MPDTFRTEEKMPQINRLRVSLEAWKIDPEVDEMICIPTEIDRIWKTATEGTHCVPKMMRVISRAVNHKTTERGKPIKANKRIIFS